MKSKMRLFAWLISMVMIISLLPNQYMIVTYAEETVETVNIDEAVIPELSTGTTSSKTLTKQSITYNYVKYNGGSLAESNIGEQTSDAYWFKFVVPAGETYTLSTTCAQTEEVYSGAWSGYVMSYKTEWSAYEGKVNINLNGFDNFTGVIGTFTEGVYYVYIDGNVTEYDVSINLKQPEDLSTIVSQAYEVTAEDMANGSVQLQSTTDCYKYNVSENGIAPLYQSSIGVLIKVVVPKGKVYSVGGGNQYIFEDGSVGEYTLPNKMSQKALLKNDTGSDKLYYVWVIPYSAGQINVQLKVETLITDCKDAATEIELDKENTYLYSSEDENYVSIIAENDYGYFNECSGRLYSMNTTAGYYDINFVNEASYSSVCVDIYDEDFTLISTQYPSFNGGETENTINFETSGKTYFFISQCNNELQFTVTKGKSTKLVDRVNDDSVIVLKEGDENPTYLENQTKYTFVTANNDGEKTYGEMSGTLYKYTVQPGYAANIVIDRMYGIANAFLDPDDVPTCSRDLWDENGMNYTYFNTGDKAKTIYLIVYAGTADYYSDHITLVVQKAGMWENACVDGNYVVEVGADKTIDLNALVDKGFIISNLVSITSNGTYDAATQKITVDDIDNVVKYVYYENKINLELQFVPYQKDDEELEETPTVKVEEEKKQDTVNGGETTVSLKVTVDGEIIGKVDETVITPEDTDATIKVTENKDVTGSVVEDVAIEVEQKVVSNDALTKSLAVVSNKNKEYENSSDNKDVKITSVVATFSDDSVDANTVIDKAVIEQLKKLDVSLEISKTNNTGEVEYKWNFDKDSIDNATAVDTKITIHNDVGTNNNSYKDKEKLDKLITTPEAKSTVLAFNHNGNLPGKTTVTVNLGDEYAENTDIYYYHFDKDNNKLDYVGKSKVGKNGMLPVVISHCSDYVLTDKFVETKTEETKPEETEPGETKPEETKPEETEPEDTKPEDTKPTESVESEKTVSVDVKYHTHIQNYGDSQGTKKNGEMAGTKGESKRLESIWVEIDGNENLGIQYTTHCQGYGWMPWSADGEVNGTSGESKRLEAIMIQLTGEDADKYDVYYRVHAQNYGWLGWAKNGEPSGTSGESKRLEGIQIVVVPKGESFNKNMEGYESATEEPYKSSGGSSPILGQDSTDGDKPVVPGADEPFVIYQTHVQTYGWQQWKINGDISGTTGESKRLEGINIKVSNMPYDGDIVYTTHVQNYGWQGELDDQTSWKKNGEMSGTSGESKRLEAICINLTGEMAEHYDIYYRVHAQNYGWLGWAKNGDKSGTAGQSKRLEGIQIVLVPKDGEAPGLSYKGITTDVDDAFIEK